MSARGRRAKPAAATTPEEAFLQALHANITDPAPWQMFADWLEERGDPNALLYRERHSTNSLGMQFVTVPAGTFWMGGGGRKAGKEQRTVTAFQIGIYPVTQGQWEALMGSNPSYFPRRGGGRNRVTTTSEEVLRAFPVETVSWYEAEVFIQKLNQRDRESGWKYRLPTEVEWEYACRGAATSKEGCSYNFYAGTPSNSLSSEQANFNGNYPHGSAARGPYLERTTRVGSYPANALGIFDMHGNVWEWCEDLFEGGPYRVLRGGDWFGRGSDCRARHREGLGPERQEYFVGFRLVRGINGPDAGARPTSRIEPRGEYPELAP